MKRLVWMIFAGALVLLFTIAAVGQTVKRSRDEGTSSIPGSNVMGNGNITAIVAGCSYYKVGDFSALPIVGAQVGITDIMELSGRFIPWTKRGMGPIDVHLQITTPANDKLRFFGIALFADLFLSTVQDTLGKTSAKDKPEYNSYPAVSLVTDLDWLAFKKWLPLKTYLKLGMVDNSDLLFKYDQIAVAAAVEWKMYQHGLFINGGVALYKEKSAKSRAGDETYAQRYVWIEPGGRYRLFSRFSVLGSAKITLYQALKEKNPFRPELFNVSLRIEAPIYCRETNAEAIRTLIFLEQKKEKKTGTADATGIAAGQRIVDGAGSIAEEGDTLGSFDYSQEREELVKRREETQKKMSEIERLFLELDKTDSVKTHGGVGVEPMVRPDSTETP
jgi:hypothetical protein